MINGKINYAALLGRAEVEVDPAHLAHVRGRRIMITGGGGSIGSTLCARLVALDAAEVVAVDNCEAAIYALMERNLPRLRARFGCVRDKARIGELLHLYKPDIVFHAAALKHVPLMEDEYHECMATNVIGTGNVAEAVADSVAKTFVIISTDKAVEPSSVMGRSKQMAEKIVRMLDRRSDAQRFLVVRFGNVLGSSGSVVPKFMAQLEAGQAITITHPQARRYLMTVREACDLTIAAAGTPPLQRGAVLALEMGGPVPITDLADRMMEQMRIAAPVRFVGLRPGEKTDERLVGPAERTWQTGIPGVLAMSS